MMEELINIGREERKYLDGKITKPKIVDERKFVTKFGTEVTNKIIKYLNKPKGSYINLSQPSLRIKTIKKEAEWFLNKTGYGHIFYSPRLTMKEEYIWEIQDEVVKSILIAILPEIKPEELLKRAKEVAKTKYFWEGVKCPMTIAGVRIEHIWEASRKKKGDVPQGNRSIYNYRDKPAYGIMDYEKISSYCKNPHILKWWNKSYDELIAKLIEKKQWYWSWYITDEVLAITPPERIKSWREQDPLCKKYAWYNVLLYFALSRAHSIGLTKIIRKARWKNCKLCGQRFLENSLPLPLVKLLGGIEDFDFCSLCLSMVYEDGSDNVTSKDVLRYLQDLARILQRIPNFDFGKGKGDFIDLDTSQRLKALKVLKSRPSVRRVKELFGSWLSALIKAGILEGDVRRTSRGIQCLAKDGHVCLSLGEKTIDDFLYKRNIQHEKEPTYPESNFRADFSVSGIFIEYFGLAGNTEYDSKIKEKEKLCRKHGIRLISIYAKDLVSTKRLELKLEKVVKSKRV